MEMSTNPTDPESSVPPPLPPLSPPPRTMEYVRLPKNPWLSVVLSVLLPGLGQVYNGEPARAFVFFFGFVGSIHLTEAVGPFPFAFLIPFVWFYGLIDAHKRASAINQRFLGGRPPEEEPESESPTWGIALVGLGLLLLVHNLGWLDFERLQRYWPVLLIASGSYFIYSSVNKRKAGESGNDPRF
jgi:hypothetical protein